MEWLYQMICGYLLQSNWVKWKGENSVEHTVCEHSKDGNPGFNGIQFKENRTMCIPRIAEISNKFY